MASTWRTLKLSEIAVRSKESQPIRDGVAYRALGVLKDGQGILEKDPFVGGETSYKKLTPVKAGQLVLRSITAWEAPIAVCEETYSDGYVSGVFPVFDLDQELVLPRFMGLTCQFQDFWREMRVRCKGTVLRRKTLSSNDLLSIPLRLPSLVEQHRIVDLIESVDSYIDALQTQADAARTARASLLHELLIDMSGDWTETTLDALGTWRSGGTPKAGTPRFYGGDIPFVAIGDLTGGVIRTTEKTLTPVGLAEIGHLAPEGSIFVSMYGSIGKIGVAGANMATNQAIAWLEPDLTLIDPAFMTSWLINHAAVFDSQGRGATQRNINRKMIRETPIVLPPLPTQNEIAHTVGSINNLIDRTEEALSLSATVRQGILAELLSGNHEIPESNNALLEAS